MENEKMGRFISALRKSKQMTQKDLAAKLNITDKAVSKWERGLSCPDISLLSAIAETLDVTTGELLNGEKSECTSENVEEIIDNVLHYADKTVKSKAISLQSICAIVFSSLLLVGAVVCAICDMAISGTFTWSLFPISSIVFVWLTFFPVIRFGEKGLWGTMIALSALIIPFLSVLNTLIAVNPLILPIGIRMSAISLLFLWSVFLLFKKLKGRKLLAGAISCIVVIPVLIIINFSLSKIIAEPLIDVWDIITFSILVIAAAALFSINSIVHKKQP